MKAGGNSNTWLFGFRAVLTIQKKGNSTSSAMITNKVWETMLPTLPRRRVVPDALDFVSSGAFWRRSAAVASRVVPSASDFIVHPPPLEEKLAERDSHDEQEQSR